jgi:phosphoribosylformylglycinamidine synthase
VARYVVDVMPKREILDPQGKAVLGALPRLGFGGVVDVRQGKRFEVEVEGDADDDRLDEVRRMAETLLANPVIEDFTVTAAALPPGEETHPWVEPEDDALPPQTPADTPEETPERDPDDTSEVPVVRDAGGPA